MIEIPEAGKPHRIIRHALDEDNRSGHTTVSRPLHASKRPWASRERNESARPKATRGQNPPRRLDGNKTPMPAHRIVK